MEPKFKVGDQVTHEASSKTGRITEIVKSKSDNIGYRVLFNTPKDYEPIIWEKELREAPIEIRPIIYIG